MDELKRLKLIAEISQYGDLGKMLDDIDRIQSERSLYQFIKHGWRYIDPAPFVDGWHIQAVCEHLEALCRGEIRHLLINQPPRTMKSISVSVALCPWVWLQRRNGIALPGAGAMTPPTPPMHGSHSQSTSTNPLPHLGPIPETPVHNNILLPGALPGIHLGPQVSFMYASYGQALSQRDSIKSRRLIQSPFYQRNWPKVKLVGDVNTVIRFENEEGGYRIATSVGGALTGEGAEIIVVDDPHNTVEIESDVTREGVLQWWDEAMSTRLNDPKTGSFIVVMQRLHEKDLSGHIISKDNDDWHHLMIPMEFEPKRFCFTGLPWADPRGLNDEGDVLVGEELEATDGALLWPKRFGPEEVKALKKSMGPFACTPGESPVLMSDLSMKPISEIKVGDEVVGFSVETNGAANRRSLQKTKILNVFEYEAEVVKIKLSSGNTIRCTPDHKWYMGKNGGSRGRDDLRPLYRSAVVGRKLMRVCDAYREFMGIEQREAAAWVSGFFDGDGSVRECKKEQQRKNDGSRHRASCQIAFYQTSERNLPICERLEKNLNALGFKYSVIEGRRKSAKPHWQTRRDYVLTTEGRNPLPLIQKFLYAVNPTKWRDRLIEGAYTANFISSQETVLSIEPDGCEKVYALETETGNYVVWGLASSNSAGQLQQMPTPRGGGIIKSDWWQTFPSAEDAPVYLRQESRWDEQEQRNITREILRYPEMEYVIAYADTAYTEAEENDYSACAVMGVWRDKNDVARLMLMKAWQGRLELHKLVQALASACVLGGKYGHKNASYVDRLVIEAKASGKSVVQEIKRLFGDERWITSEGTVKGDKVARAYSIQYLFADEMVFAPDRSWVDKVIQECSNFPKGEHDDLPDAVFGAIKWLRDNGMIEMRRERQIRTEYEVEFRSKEKPLYDV